jgi:hypothetical protein
MSVPAAALRRMAVTLPPDLSGFGRVVTRAELLRTGLSRRGVLELVRNRELTALDRGTFSPRRRPGDVALRSGYGRPETAQASPRRSITKFARNRVVAS